MPQKSKLWATALLAGTLLLGGAAGAITGRLVGDTACPTSDRERARGAEERDYLTFLSEELDLTPEQRQRTEQIVERHRERMSGLWKEVRPRLDSIKEELRSDLRATLRPEQRARYDELVRERERRWERKKK